MANTVKVRGEGGTVWEMDLPLRPDHQKRIAAGLMHIVSDGGAVLEPADVPTEVLGDEDDELGADDSAPELEAFLAEEPKPAKKAAAKPA